MKVVGVREAQKRLAGLIDIAQRERVVLTRHGRFVAVLSGVEDRDVEAVVLAHDDAFWQQIEVQRRRGGAELIPHAELKAALLPRQRSSKRRGSRRRDDVL